MSRPQHPGRTPARLAALLLALAVLVPSAASALPVEDFAPYQPQQRCNPTPKPGTLKLAAWLQRTYPGTGSLGISRACGASGVSEHKEGRAFDWAVNYESARDRAYVKDFLADIFASDAAGHAAAKARRMGIMYLIWNDHIYASYSGFAKRPYLHDGCRTKKSCSVTLRHRNHVHISLSKGGGRGDTSWYHRNDTAEPTPKPKPEPPAQPQKPKPQKPQPEKPRPEQPTPPGPPVKEPVPDPGPVLDLARRDYARVWVPGDGSVVYSRFSLKAGKAYQVTVAGLFTFGSPDEVADASCVWSPSAGAWQPEPEAAQAAAHGGLGLTLNREAAFGSSCHTSGHEYAATYTPERTGPIRLQVDNRAPGATGNLVVVVSKRHRDITEALPTYPDLAPAPQVAAEAPRGFGLLDESVSVPAAAVAGAVTNQELEQGATYRITVSGVVGLGNGVESDGLCLGLSSAWWATATLDRRHPEQDHGNLYVDGVPFAGRPLGDGCNAHANTADYTATRSGRLGVSLWDPLTTADNTGALTVRVQRTSAFATPIAAEEVTPGDGDAWDLTRDWFTVSAADPEGTRSAMKVRKGEQVQVFVRGATRSGGIETDARCVSTSAGWVDRDPGTATPQDPMELWVDGSRVFWRSIGQGYGCSDENAYTTRFTATKSGKLKLTVADLDHRDNDGVLQVTLLRQR